MLDTFTKWMSSSRLVFFPAYTSHGVDHFQGVLSTAADLVSERSLKVITPADVAVLVQAVLLHDCGMHLTEDGFLYMKSIEATIGAGNYFRDMPWPLLWTKFLDEAKRFNGRILRDIFGDEQPVDAIPVAPQDWTERHRMLIGEFIRRNHPRIAHEIAIRGIPGHSGFSELIPISQDRRFADISGLVARSHGLDLRSCLSYLDQHYDVRDYNGCHIVYTMVVLRAADYLQMQSNRAPTQYSDYKRIRSPLSQNEWRVHRSVENINMAHEDPEALYVKASPQTNAVYLRLASWLADLQHELDKSWAILGEVYGRFGSNNFDKLGITIRRVRSNVDDPTELAKTAAYIPGDIRLTVDNVEAFGLLVGPLYNDKVEIGIRELVQNSVDAVREMDSLIASGLSIADGDRVACQGDVEVAVVDNPDGAILTIRDKGLGMTLEVLRNYFLRAGASYRRSDEWRRNFEDRSGHSKVMRSGRFGVGALAAFLLGDTITVRTRSALARGEGGYVMTYLLSEDTIEVGRCDCLIGTEIQVKLSQRADSEIKRMSKRQSWQQDELGFYRLRKPALHMNIFGRSTNLNAPVAAPGDYEGWEIVEHPDFRAVFWRTRVGYSRPTICNGIVVFEAPSHRLHKLFSGDDEGPQFLFPEVSIFDQDGLLPINLARTSVNWSEAACANAIALSPLRANNSETSTPREFDLEGAEGSSRSCPCSTHQSMPRQAPP
jgi:molecular chaperone HtpG